jgi:hypothetical protein
MATKKTPIKKTKTSRKKKPVREYCCPNPERPYSLYGIVTKIMDEPEFARFIRAQLCAANRGNEAAIACVESYYKPKNSELGSLCIPPAQRLMYMKCTDQNRLIDVLAVVFSERRS